MDSRTKISLENTEKGAKGDKLNLKGVQLGKKSKNPILAKPSAANNNR